MSPAHVVTQRAALGYGRYLHVTTHGSSITNVNARMRLDICFLCVNVSGQMCINSCKTYFVTCDKNVDELKQNMTREL